MPATMPRQQDPAVPYVNPLYQTPPAISQAQDRPIPQTAAPSMPAPAAPPSGPAPGTNPALASAADPLPGSATDAYLQQWRSSMDASRSIIDRDLGEAFRQIQGANAGAAQTLAQLPGAVTQSYAMNAPDPMAAAAAPAPTGAAGVAAGAVSSDVDLGGGGYGPLQAALDANAANQASANGLIQQAAAAAAAQGGGSGGGGGGGGGSDGLTPLQLLRDQRDQEEIWRETHREDVLMAQEYARQDEQIALEERWRQEDQAAADSAWERDNTDADADQERAWAREDDVMQRELDAQSAAQKDQVLFDQGWDYGFNELDAYRKSPQYQLANTMATLGEGDDWDRITGDQIAARFAGDQKTLQALVVDGIITPEDIMLAKEGGSKPIDEKARDAVANRMRIARENTRPEKRPTVDPTRRPGAFAGATARGDQPARQAPAPAPRTPAPSYSSRQGSLNPRPPARDLQDQDRGVRRPTPTRRTGPR